MLHHRSQRFRILNAPLDDPRRTVLRVVVDTIEDFRRLETTSSIDKVEMEAKQSER